MTTKSRTPRHAFWKFSIPVVGLLAVILIALSILRSKMQQPQSSGAGSGQEQAAVDIHEGGLIPQFNLQEYKSGKAVPIDQIDGKVRLINFWATWCEACMVEMPSIVKLYEAYKDKGLKVVFVNVDENPEAVLPPVLKRLKIDFPVYLDRDGAVADIFDVHAIPLTVITDNFRKVLLMESGERDWNGADLRAQLDQWLKK
jgi:thiol-disulfide isomerase/thioredoxin